MRKLRSLSSLLFPSLFGIAILSPSAPAQTNAPNEWTWMSGSSTEPALGSGYAGVYGSLGIPANGNKPGSRSGASTLTDKGGNLWLFGGVGFDANGTRGFLNDFWEFIPATREWAWMGGSSVVPMAYGGSAGVYGTKGVPSTANFPGGRAFATSWIDRNGHLWMFGGEGADANGMVGSLNDLWEFNPALNEWVWMSGSNIVSGTVSGSQPGVYGTLGAPAPGNIPGGRVWASSWIDSTGNLWLYGGWGTDANNVTGWLNDLWEFSPSTNEWVWISGSSTLNYTHSQPGVYGTMGTPAAGNVPGGRYMAASWTDNNGHLWLFGGDGEDADLSLGFLNDLWEFNPSTGEWTWMGGSNILSINSSGYHAYSGVYGVLWSFAASNYPGSREYASTWADDSGHLWLFGGWGFDANGNGGALNDLWAFDPSMNEWMWIGGSSTVGSSCDNGSCNQVGVYGILGTPAAGNIPGGRSSAASWTDSNGNFWLFGGSDNHANSEYGDLNDLWRYQTPVPAASPVISLPTGSYTGAQKVTISDAMAGTTIYYTNDGKIPSVTSNLYTGAITVSTNETIQAIAVAANYFNSATASATYAITIVPDFSIAASPASFTVTAGQSGNTAIAVTPVDGFNSAVSFACSGLPSGASCSFSPTTVTPSGAAASTTLTVATSATAASVHRNPSPLFPGSVLAVGLCCFGRMRRRRLQMLLLFAVAFAGLGLLNACGGGGSSGGTRSTPVTSTVTVTGTSGSLTHATTFSLTVD